MIVFWLGPALRRGARAVAIGVLVAGAWLGRHRRDGRAGAR